MKKKNKGKPDVFRNNDDLAEVLEEHQKRGVEEKFTLRIDSKTVIYVTKDKCNAEYAEAYRKRINDATKIVNGKFIS